MRNKIDSRDRCRHGAPVDPSGGGRAADAQTGAGERQLVLVQFKGHRKSYYHNDRLLPLAAGQYCVVEADRGRDMGRVNYIGPGKPEWWNIARKQGVLAVADNSDLERLHNNRGDEWEFWDICREKIQKRRLKMNLVSVERQFDHKKITFYFTAEKRVDFRELVRDLAAVFRTRIELRQIGVRDEARLKGGLGICGREFCCSRYLHEFVPVTLKMAKVQQLPLNPGKLSGPCSRLRCCLTFEHEVYQDLRRSLPRVGARVATPRGEGTVRKLDLMRESVAVLLPDQDGLVTFGAADLGWEGDQELPAPRPRDRGPDGGCGGCGKPQGGGPDGDGGGA
jgi:cell fate regulator YaaT (PSP1 superfamily)